MIWLLVFWAFNDNGKFLSDAQWKFKSQKDCVETAQILVESFKNELKTGYRCINISQ